MLLLVCRSISLMISESGIFLMDNVASIDLARDLSAFVNLATLLTTHFWKIKLLPPLTLLLILCPLLVRICKIILQTLTPTLTAVLAGVDSAWSFSTLIFFYTPHQSPNFTTMDAKILPAMIAPNDNPTFANIFSPKIETCLLSKRFVDSRAREDMVVKEPQNPTATRRKYFVSRFQTADNIENTPNTKLPSTFTARILSGNAPRTMGDDTNLYLRKAPARAPTAKKINSIPLIFVVHLPLLFIGRHYQRRSGFGLILNPRLMP